MTDDLAAALRTEGADVGAELAELVQSLVSEGLLVQGAPAAPGPPPPPVAEPAPWLPLALETFTDMQDLILLDPVHEVQPEQGWPVSLDLDRT